MSHGFDFANAKSLIIYNNANFSTQVGEAVDYLTAEIEEYPKRSSVTQLLKIIDKNVVFSTYVKVGLNEDFTLENIAKILISQDKKRGIQRIPL